MPFPLSLLFAFALAFGSGFAADRLQQPVVPALMVIGTALWVYFDGKRVGLARYRTLLLNPEVVTILCFLLWIIAFPWYRHVRWRIANGTMPLREAPPPGAG